MPSDIEIGDSDSFIFDTEITLNPDITANIKPASEREVYRCKKYLRRPGVRAVDAPLVIWRVGQEYERNRKEIWIELLEGKIQVMESYCRDLDNRIPAAPV